MPKYPTFPTLYDEVKQIDIADLKKWGYLKPEQTKSGVLTWSKGGQETGSIFLTVNTQSKQPYVELDYQYNNELRFYRVRLVSLPSHLGRGHIWYFLCPKIKKRCRKLYSVGGYFYHREAFSGCMYETQTQSKKYRQMDRALKAFFKTDELYNQLYKKYFKKTYAGKPTKRYLRIKKQLQKTRKLARPEIKRLLLD